MNNNQRLSSDEKKKEEELNSLIYLKQYDRKISAYMSLLSKPSVYFATFMGYLIYNDSIMPIAGYVILVFGLVVIYRNFVSEKYYETESIFLLKRLIKILNFFVAKGREKTRRFVNVEAERKKEEKRIRLEARKEKKRLKELNELDEEFNEDNEDNEKK